MLEKTFSITLLTFVAAAAHAATPAPATDVTALQAKVAELESRLAEVEGGDQWLTEQRAAEIRSLVQDVLNDADTRASLQGSGMTAGWDKGFFLASADGKFKLQIAGQLQIRYAYNYLDDDTQDKNREGFEIRRAKLAFKGHVFDKTWKFEFQPTWSRQVEDGSNSALENAWVEKDLGDGFAVKFGQFKAPFMREELVSSSKQLAVDRSVVNEEFNQDYSQGVELGWKGEQFGVKLMYGDGFNTDNTSALTRVSEWGAFTGRVEWKIAGEWKQFDDFNSWNGDPFGAMIGVAGHIENQEFGTTDNGEILLATATADATLDFGGANLFGSIVYRYTEPNGGSEANALAFTVQGGFFVVPDQWELFARYEFGDLDTPGQSDASVATVGVNRFFDKNNLKWTTDVGFSFDALTSGWSSLNGIDYRNTNQDDAQLVVRSQFQLLF